MNRDLVLAVAVVWAGVYLPAAWVLLAGTWRLPRTPLAPDASLPSVSIVVSARNEAEDLPDCLAALRALDYPADRIEILLVNDLSTDSTGALCDAATVDPRFRALHTAQLPANGLEAKARGVAHGIAAARHDWILITDADAIVPPHWARAMLSHLRADTAIVGGTVVVARHRWWSAPERMSWAFLQLIALGAAGWGIPFIVFGPNMGIRRAVYEAAGGLTRSPLRVAEDLALFLLATHAGGRVEWRYQAETTVTLRPVPSAAHLLSQHRRWLGGGIEAGGRYAWPLWVGVLWGLGAMSFVALGWMLSLRWWAVIVSAKLLTELVHLRAQSARLGLRQHARLLGVLQLYHLLMLVYLPLSFVFDRRVRWRGAGYVVRYD